MQGWVWRARVTDYSNRGRISTACPGFDTLRPWREGIDTTRTMFVGYTATDMRPGRSLRPYQSAWSQQLAQFHVGFAIDEPSTTRNLL